MLLGNKYGTLRISQLAKVYYVLVVIKKVYSQEIVNLNMLHITLENAGIRFQISTIRKNKNMPQAYSSLRLSSDGG